MKFASFSIALICAICSVFGQTEISQAVQDLKVLSADSLEGRELATSGSIKAQRYIQKRFKEINISPFGESYLRTFTLKESGKTGTNIVGYIKGKSDSIIVVTAHYDHLGIKEGKIYNGADDNASGVAGLLAIATAFTKSQPKHTLVIAALDAEEGGLKGAEALLVDFPLETALIRLNANMDMISHNDVNELYAVGTYHYPALIPILEQVKSTASIKLLLGHDKPKDKLEDWTFSSDHFPFHKRKIPFIYFGVEDHQDYHKDSDTFENTNPAFLNLAIETIIAVIIEADANY
jgi:Zn-dependent M28 family amino/carboxypeptidase